MKIAEIDVSEMTPEIRADVQKWALDSIEATAEPKTIRQFLLSNISPTAFVAGKWADWHSGWSPKRGAEARLEFGDGEPLKPGVYEMDPLDFKELVT